MNLRDELSGLADQAGPYANPDKALTKARTRRVTRLALAPAALVLAAVVAVPFGMNHFQGEGASPAGSPSSAPDLGVDYLTGNVLHTTGGEEFVLDAPDDGRTTVERIPLGWLVWSYNPDGSNNDGFLLKLDGSTVPLPGFQGGTLSADGTRVAWGTGTAETGGRFKVSRITENGLEEIGSVPLTEVNSIAGWSGDRVIFFNADESNGSENAEVSWGSWDPTTPFELGSYEGSPDFANLDGQTLTWVETGDGEGWCMLKSDAATGAELDRRCDIELSFGLIDWSTDGAYGYGVRSQDAEEWERVIFRTADLFASETAQPVSACGLGSSARGTWSNGVLYAIDDMTSLVTVCDVDGETLGTKQLDQGSRLVRRYGV